MAGSSGPYSAGKLRALSAGYSVTSLSGSRPGVAEAEAPCSPTRLSPDCDTERAGYRGDSSDPTGDLCTVTALPETISVDVDDPEPISPDNSDSSPEETPMNFS